MSDLIAKSRVSWALVVVTLSGVKSLHLIKKSYRGKITYYSKSARGVTDKIGFGEVVSCQSGVRKENGVRVDYMEFRNNKQQVTNWQLEEFEPTLDGGDFGRRLQILRSNPQQLCIYLNHLIRSLSWNLHNPDLHTDLGEAKEENIYPLNKDEKEDVRKLKEITKSESVVLKAIKSGKIIPQKASGKSSSKEQVENKKESIVNSKSGLEANFQKGILGFEQIDAEKITTHKGVINEKLDRNKIESLKRLLNSQFDPKLSVVTVAPCVKTAAEYDKTNPDVTYKVLEGRHLFTAMKELYSEGKSFKGLEEGKVMVVVLNNPGVIAANYANFRQRHLSDQYTSEIHIQDFVKLFKRINDVIKDRNQAVEIVKNSMITFNFHKDDVTALCRIAKWAEHNVSKLIEILDFFENFQSLDSEKKKKSNAQLMKSGRKLPVPKLTFHRVAKMKEENLLEIGQQFLDREITLTDLATWSLNLSKLDEVKQQCLEIAQEVVGRDDVYDVFEDLEKNFPVELSDAKLVGFSKSVKGDGFKTGDRMRLEKYIVSTVTSDGNNNENRGTIDFVEMESLSSSFFSEADCVILNSDVLYCDCLEYFMKKIFLTNASLVIICKSQAEYHLSIENIQALKDQEDEHFKLFSLVVKDHSVKSNEGHEISSCGLIFVVLTGRLCIQNPPLKLSYEGLSLCLGEIVEQVSPQGGKVYSVNYRGSAICVIPPRPSVSYTYFGSGAELQRAKQLTARKKFDSQNATMESEAVND